MEWQASDIIAGLALLSSFVLGVIQFRKHQAEANAADGDAADKISSAWERLNDPLIKELHQLRDEVRDLRAEVLRLSAGIDVLTAQITEAGLQPRWQKHQ